MSCSRMQNAYETTPTVGTSAAVLRSCAPSSKNLARLSTIRELPQFPGDNRLTRTRSARSAFSSTRSCTASILQPRLRRFLPVVSFMVLVPFVGSELMCKANESWRKVRLVHKTFLPSCPPTKTYRLRGSPPAYTSRKVETRSFRLRLWLDSREPFCYERLRCLLYRDNARRFVRSGLSILT